MSQYEIKFAFKKHMRQHISYALAYFIAKAISLAVRRISLHKKRTTPYWVSLFLVRETGLEPVRDYHTPLKRARLPIPPLSRVL